MQLTSRPLLLRSTAMAALLPFSVALAQNTPAQLATPTVRITTPIVNSALVTLKGNVHPLAQPRYDKGAASSELPSGKMTLLLRRSATQQEALQEYLGNLQDPNSPSYHKWLTPQAYGASFGIAPEDLQTVEGWLESAGFKIEGVPPSGNLLQFSGTLGEVAQAFHTSIHSYLINGVTHYSNASDPQIPAALAPVIAGISPLNDFRAHPEHVSRSRVQVAGKNGSMSLVAQPQAAGAPALTGGIGTATYLFVTPADAATIYNSPNQLNRNYTGGAPGNEGAGVNIGIANYSNLNTADYANFRRLFLNESSPAAVNIVVDGGDPGVLTSGDGTEALIDTELAAGVAPKANIYLYTSSSDVLEDGLGNAVLRAIEDNNVSVLSVSYGTCEPFLGQSGNQQYAEFWEEAAAQGITPVVATGDQGSASCDAGDGTNMAARYGLTVNGLASTPYNVAVGGTDFDVLLNSFTQYVTDVGGVAGTAPFYGSALSYIPENPWNDSISNNPVSTYNTDVAAEYNDGPGTSNFIVLDAGGGGASSAGLCTVQDSYGNCLSPGYATPPFQTGISVGSAAPAGVRYLPDVSMYAAPGSQHSAAWALCSDSTTDGGVAESFNSSTGGGETTYTDCTPSADGSFYIEPIGGTSASTPTFAGVLGLVTASLGTGTRLGVADDVLYNLFAKGGNAAFNDVTAGNISVPCAAGSANCVATVNGNTFLAGYNAGTGYDLATGLGSVNITNLINAWPTATFTGTSTALSLNGTAAPITITHGTTVALAAQVTPNTATGTVSVTGATGHGSGAENDYISLTNGAGSINSPYLPGGTYSIHAYYPGDVTHAASTSGSIQVTVTPEASSLTTTGTQSKNPNFYTEILDISSNSQTTDPTTATYGEYGFAYVVPGNTANTVQGFASGTATLLSNGAAVAIPQVNGVNVNPQALNSYGTAAFPLYDLAPGSYSFSATYSGDASYNPSASTTAIPLTISKGPTSVTVHTNNSTLTSQQIYVELDTDSTGLPPTGTVTLTLNGTNYPGTVTNGVNNGAIAEYATFAIPATALQGSNNKLGASYVGDNNYVASSASACTFSPSASAAVTPGAGQGGGLLFHVMEGSTALSAALFFLIPARRRAWRSMLVALFAICLMGAIGCGGTSSTSVPITTLTACAN